MDTMYFVSWYIHNKKDNEWNGTIVDQYTSYDAAEKSYHTQLGMYIDDEQFDSVAVFMTDSKANTIMSRWWHEEVAPTPEPNEGE